MNRALPVVVAILVLVDLYTLSLMQAWRSRPDLTPRVDQLEKDLSQAEADIGELKQEVLLIQRRGQAAD